MSMRKYRRAVARHNMQKCGITRINKKFARNWRKYINK